VVIDQLYINNFHFLSIFVISICYCRFSWLYSPSSSPSPHSFPCHVGCTRNTSLVSRVTSSLQGPLKPRACACLYTYTCFSVYCDPLKYGYITHTTPQALKLSSTERFAQHKTSVLFFISFDSKVRTMCTFLWPETLKRGSCLLWVYINNLRNILDCALLMSYMYFK
jgi:hypothetical protein